MRRARSRVRRARTLMTTKEQPTTLRARPSASSLHRPHHSPSVLLAGTVIRLTLASVHSACTSLV
jgi:hypothetical protein